ncbi:MAG: hypothetical protein HY359_04760 [Candidatus Rokubacteria bacterium]|nr:hypothetical protein [Candidatus Rokubacteria bacterium]
MRGTRRCPVFIGIIVLGQLFLSVAVRAQSSLVVTPSVSLTEVYDDNLFSTSDRREADVISRFGLGLRAAYESAPLRLLGAYSLDAEVFGDHPKLTDPAARQEVRVELEHRPTRRLKLSLTGEYADTHAAGEFNVATGLEPGRVRAERLSVGPSLAYRFDPLTTGTATYRFTRDRAEGVVTESHVADIGLDRRVTARDTAGLSYGFREFVFTPGGTVTSHVAGLGWTHEITPLTSLTLRGGSRVSDGSVDPEVSIVARRRLERGELSLTYSRTQTTVIGEAGTVETDGLTAGLAYEVLSRFEVRAAPTFFSSRRAGREAKVYGVSLEATYRINRSLSLTGSYTFNLRQGSLDTGRPVDEEVFHNVFWLRLTVTYPYRLD